MSKSKLNTAWEKYEPILLLWLQKRDFSNTLVRCILLYTYAIPDPCGLLASLVLSSFQHFPHAHSSLLISLISSPFSLSLVLISCMQYITTYACLLITSLLFPVLYLRPYLIYHTFWDSTTVRRDLGAQRLTNENWYHEGRADCLSL